MNSLESPLEALFLAEYYSLTTAKSFWTWIAFLTAAVSFWRITAVVSRSPIKPNPSPPTETAIAPPPPLLKSQTTPVASSSNLSGREGEVGPTKTKFAVYHCCDKGLVDDEEAETHGDSCYDAVSEIGSGSGAMLPVVRTWDLGWYSWQDTSALDGSVVRLWGRSNGARTRRRCNGLVMT